VTPFEDYTSDEKRTDSRRVLALSDGVFAVAITLLVLAIQLPDLPPTRSLMTLNTRLLQSLLALGPTVLGYIISFLVVGANWRVHRHVFRHIKRYDTAFLTLNLLLLLSVSFLPLPTSVIGRYPGSWVAVVFYALCLALTGVMTLPPLVVCLQGVPTDRCSPGEEQHQVLRHLLPDPACHLSAFHRPGICQHLSSRHFWTESGRVLVAPHSSCS